MHYAYNVAAESTGIDMERLLRDCYPNSTHYAYSMAAESTGIDMEQLLHHCHSMYTWRYLQKGQLVAGMSPLLGGGCDPIWHVSSCSGGVAG